MSKLNVGVGEDFPLRAERGEDRAFDCGWGRFGRHGGDVRDHDFRRYGGARALGAFLIIPVAAASVTAAIVYPLTTLGIAVGAGALAAAHHHGRRERWHEWRHMRRRPDGDGPNAGPQPDIEPDAPQPPKDER